MDALWEYLVATFLQSSDVFSVWPFNRHQIALFVNPADDELGATVLALPSSPNFETIVSIIMLERDYSMYCISTYAVLQFLGRKVYTVFLLMKPAFY